MLLNISNDLLMTIIIIIINIYERHLMAMGRLDFNNMRRRLSM